MKCYQDDCIYLFAIQKKTELLQYNLRKQNAAQSGEFNAYYFSCFKIRNSYIENEDMKSLWNIH